MKTALEGNSWLSDKIKSGEPFHVGKIGAVEQTLIRCKMRGQKYDQWIKDSVPLHTGITPPSDEVLDYFSGLIFSSVKHSSAMGCAGYGGEEDLIQRITDSEIFGMRFLEPYYFGHPWSQALKGKKVLVIHPFEETIISQYKKRELLFDMVLPEFELLTIKAPLTNGQNGGNSMEEFGKMYEKITMTDFDIALIGCGGYGLPLAYVIGGLWKQAVHIGGALQILFGIKGARWDAHEEISRLYNDNWVRPLESERPSGHNLIENGCYW